SDASVDRPVRILAGEFLRIRTGIRMRRAIGIAFHGNCRHGYDRTCSELLLQIVISRLAVNDAKTPPVIVNHDLSMIRILEGRCAAIERGIVEVPFWRSLLPNELGKIVSIFFVAGPAAFGRKIILIPPLELSAWRQRHPAGGLAADQITTH